MAGYKWTAYFGAKGAIGATGAIGPSSVGNENYVTPSATQLGQKYFELAGAGGSPSHMIWDELAKFVSNYVQQANSHRPPSIPLGNGWETNWETIAKRYARHSPRCDTGGTCDCGFGEIETLMPKAGGK